MLKEGGTVRPQAGPELGRWRASVQVFICFFIYYAFFNVFHLQYVVDTIFSCSQVTHSTHNPVYGSCQ